MVEAKAKKVVEKTIVRVGRCTWLGSGMAEETAELLEYLDTLLI